MALRSPRLVGPRPAWPHAIEDAYRRRLLRRAAAAKNLLDEFLLPALQRMAPEINALAAAHTDSGPPAIEDVIAAHLAEIGRRRTDGIADILGGLLRVVDTVKRAFGMAYEPTPQGVTGIGEQASLFTARALEKSYPSVFPIAVGKTPEAARAVELWADENVRLITSIDARYFDDIRKTIIEAVQKGTQTKEIAKLLRERYAVSKSRATLIAQDQIAKLNADITREKQTKLGITQYTWSTSHDERVRATHRVLDGTVQDWNSPPVSEKNGERNHPGMAVRCRCVSLPYFSDDEPATPFAYPKLSASRPTIYGSRERPLSPGQARDLQQRLGR